MKMKKVSLKGLNLLFIICLTLSLGSCATTENDLKKTNRLQPLTFGPPAYIHFTTGKDDPEAFTIQEGLEVMLTRTPTGDWGPSSSGMHILKDTDITFSAYVCDADGRQTDIKPNWKASNPAVLSISPSEGNAVTVRGMMKGITDIIIEASGLKKVVSGIAVE